MQAEIITIGDEILIGQIVDSNSSFIGRKLGEIGIDVAQITSISDQREHILTAMSAAAARVDVVLITGGLGPTKDDVTKATLCEFFQDSLQENEEVLAHIEMLFTTYLKKPTSELNRLQAMVPSQAIVLKNEYGTAPGMWMEKDGTVFIAMPGVPFEMENIMLSGVLPRLQTKFERPFILHTTIQTYGIGESDLAIQLEDWEDNLPPFIKLAYLPQLGRVRLRLSARGTDQKRIEEAVAKEIASLQKLIGTSIVSIGEDPIEKRIGALLKEKGYTLAAAESCTGGKVAHTISAVEGASAYFVGGIVSYATRSKTEVLGVEASLIERYSVTSIEVAERMALKAKEKFGSDYAIATTGNAGPDKGDGDVEVGTIFLAVATPDGVSSKEVRFGKNRAQNVARAVNKSLEMVFNLLK
ncbi:CinA family nicotinamide mononucleotide deamidase-related protein [Aquimarina sp. TRL1]|uniref:CinA family nicotinamide mononucleotide deamidase-related protein n=1 Tax=Aquimarina sp. (strain TRL1) TaxID=2736252 RepID=UPI00158F3FFE|nr:CinA family nicotinamide mononucleotide deamidase-related protein [Aquimarina sp. TRL1]QKX05948.1 CinA family nicotinamide mononucleotide deamidase-related protein [Aquimarina sp. TRL1]